MTRRDLLKSGVAVTATTALSAEVASTGTGDQAILTSDTGLPRARLLLDTGWRFSLGHAEDPTRDFGYGGGKGETFAKSGDLFAPSIKYDDSA